MRARTCEMRVDVTSDIRVPALLCRPVNARWLLVLAHGAGAGMRHAFLEDIAARLATGGIASLRYQFPYMECGRRRPDPPALLQRTVRAAVAAARRAAPELELVAGGKSMGGRMTSMAEAGEPLEGVRGLVFLGFPLHPARRPASTRGEHLARIARPMLFLQGTRDPLADLALVRPLCASLGPRAALVICDDADHGFAVRRSAGRSDAAVRQELVDAVAAWLDRL